MKRIVICADGTWNERDRLDARTGTRRPTAVTKTARAVLTQVAMGISQRAGLVSKDEVDGLPDLFARYATGFATAVLAPSPQPPGLARQRALASDRPPNRVRWLKGSRQA